jgi:hypothetical protein
MTLSTLPRLERLEKLQWEKRIQVTWIAPIVETGPAGDLPNVPMKPPPRPNVVISITPTTRETAADAMDDFIRQTRPVVPGLTEIERWPAKIFADGCEGTGLVIEFPATPDVTLRQTHLFRIDDGVLTQLVATIAADGDEAEEDLLLESALAYRPDP